TFEGVEGVGAAAFEDEVGQHEERLVAGVAGDRADRDIVDAFRARRGEIGRELLESVVERAQVIPDAFVEIKGGAEIDLELLRLRLLDDPARERAFPDGRAGLPGWRAVVGLLAGHGPAEARDGLNELRARVGFRVEEEDQVPRGKAAVDEAD